MTMVMSNFAIYNAAKALLEAFNDSQRLPIKVNFYLQKNKTILINLAKDIDNARIEIIKAHQDQSVQDSEHITIDPAQMDIVTQELEDLFALEQELQIYKIDIGNMPDDIVLTSAQMEALMCMIE